MAIENYLFQQKKRSDYDLKQKFGQSNKMSIVSFSPPPSKALMIESLTERLSCPVGMSLIEKPLKAFPCHHVFEASQIEGWLKQGKRTCPVDRLEIVSLEEDAPFRALVKEVELLSTLPEEEVAKKFQEISQKIDDLRESTFAENKERLKAEQDALQAQVSLLPKKDGLYLLGRCEKIECSAHGNPVWIHKKGSHFDLAYEIHQIVCPTCQKDYDDINTAAIYGFRYIWKGKKKVGDRCSVKIDENEGKWSFFPRLSDWRFLTVDVLEDRVELHQNESRNCCSMMIDIFSRLFNGEPENE